MATKNKKLVLDPQVYHTSVLPGEVVHYLSPQPGGVYVDATFGGGGHTRAILEHEQQARVIALDWDTQAIEKHRAEFEQDFPGRIQFVWGNFAFISKLLSRIGIKQVDGVIADFGTSHYQIRERAGFSVYKETPLDMRMSTAHYRTTAAHVVNTYSEQALADIFWQLGEEREARRIARALVAERAHQRISTTAQLARLIERIVPPGKQKIHSATRVFQALRIYVNKELENIQGLLAGALQVVRPGGRIVCISFHSLEDRLVKQFFKEHERTEGLYVQSLTHGVVRAQEQELAINPSSRSARLRAVQVLK